MTDSKGYTNSRVNHNQETKLQALEAERMEEAEPAAIHPDTTQREPQVANKMQQGKNYEMALRNPQSLN